MKKLTVSNLRRILEDTNREWISDYLNSDETQELFLMNNKCGCRYNCRVILKEKAKSSRVTTLLLIFPKYSQKEQLMIFLSLSIHHEKNGTSCT